MLNARVICDIKESEKVGDELVREFKELDCAIDQGSIRNGMEFYKYLGGLLERYDAWEKNHQKLLVKAHVETNGD